MKLSLTEVPAPIEPPSSLDRVGGRVRSLVRTAGLVLARTAQPTMIPARLRSAMAFPRAILTSLMHMAFMYPLQVQAVPQIPCDADNI